MDLGYMSSRRTRVGPLRRIQRVVHSYWIEDLRPEEMSLVEEQQLLEEAELEVSTFVLRRTEVPSEVAVPARRSVVGQEMVMTQLEEAPEYFFWMWVA